MKETGDIEKSPTQKVKKFRYVPPQKKTTTIHSFSNKSDSPIPASSKSFDPEKAWSIRKDVSVSMTSPQASSLFRYGFLTSDRRTSPKGNIYSRHSGAMLSSSNAMLNANDSNGTNQSQPTRTWHSSSSHDSGLSYSRNNLPPASNDGVDFPTSSCPTQTPTKQSMDHRKHYPASKL